MGTIFVGRLMSRQGQRGMFCVLWLPCSAAPIHLIYIFLCRPFLLLLCYNWLQRGDFKIKIISCCVVAYFELDECSLDFTWYSYGIPATPWLPQQNFSTSAPFVPHIHCAIVLAAADMNINTWTYPPFCDIPITFMNTAAHDKATQSNPPSRCRQICLLKEVFLQQDLKNGRLDM